MASDTTTPDEREPRAGQTADTRQTGQPAEFSAAEDIDWRGWLLVGVVVVSFLVVPLLVLSFSQTHWLLTWLGFSQRQAYLVFPMVPALLLGVTVVWATIRTHAE
jgi:hypothetical protein